MNLIAHTDGGARGTPGPAGCGVVIRCGDKVIEEIAAYQGIATNNVAEYHALLHALVYAVSAKADSLVVYADSELVVKQIRGEYAVHNPELAALHAQATEMIAGIPAFSIYHVRRAYNSHADRLANRAMNEATGKVYCCKRCGWPNCHPVCTCTCHN